MADDLRLLATFFLSGHEAVLTVHALRGHEEVSRPYRFEVDFSGQDVDVDAAPGSKAYLQLESLRGGQRGMGGVVEELSLVASGGRGEDHHTRYRAVLAPEPYVVLANRTGFRIFQEKTTQQILQELCKDAGLDDALFDWKGLSGSYVKREYCVQYGESEWDFLCRLLEDEGIFFAFTHEADGTRMRFEDQSGKVDALEPGELEFTFQPGHDGMMPRVWDFRVQTRLRPAKATVNDYDMLRPSTSLLASAEAQEAVAREWYEYPGGYRANAEGKRRAQVRLDEQRTPRVVARGKTNALFAEPGRRFQLVEHPASGGEYFLTSVSFHLRLEEEPHKSQPLVDAGPWLYQVDFEAIPSEQAFRPARRTPRPRVWGAQTAKVTGPAGEEIYCDEHGRVKLQFPWDREGQLDERTSCWVRVVQAHTTGSIMIPRIGWEVLVEFEDGDPDRPICLGKVWNSFFPPPKELPAGKTQTGHSTLSSPGGGGVNEVIFDDTAGEESVTIHGQFDINVKAANNKMFNVGHNVSHEVNGNRTASVGSNEQVAVEANQNLNVGGNSELSVGAMRDVKVTGSATEEIAGDFSLTVGGMEMIMVGSPAAAVLETIKEAAVEAAKGLKAELAKRAEAKILGPIMPVIEKARNEIGEAALFASGAASVLGDSPGGKAFTDAAGKLSKVEGALKEGEVLTGLMSLAMSGGGAPAAGGAEPAGAGGAASGGGAGGGGGGGDAAPEAAAGATSGGSGTWGVVVVGAVTETVGGLAAINSLKGVKFGVEGAATETVGAARVELIGGGKSEETGAAKLETVGTYVLNLKESLAIDAKGIVLNIAGAQKQSISGSHSISAGGPVVVTAPRLKLKGSGTITLTCGKSKVVVKSGGIFVEGPASLTIEGGQVELDENALGT